MYFKRSIYLSFLFHELKKIIMNKIINEKNKLVLFNIIRFKYNATI